MLHVATGCALPKRAWNEQAPHVWIGDVNEEAEPVREHFSLPSIAYVGSDLNCGCGFRSVMFQNGGWPEEYLIAEGEIETEGTQRNHQELHAALTDALRHSVVVELYGCWTDHYREKTEGEQEIEADDILSQEFFFRERVLYRVRANRRGR